MKSLISAALLLASLAALPAAADSIVKVSVKDTFGKQAQAVICIGDATDPVRFGAIETGADGVGAFPVPELDASLQPIPEIVVQAYGPLGGFKQTLIPEKAKSGVSIKLNAKLKIDCGKIDLAPANKLLDRPDLPNIRIVLAHEPGLTPDEAAARNKSFDLPVPKEPQQKSTSTTIPASPVIQNNGETCFGAAGQQCGLAGGQPGLSSCRPLILGGSADQLICSINVGSWKHDTCCVANPDGHMCGGDVASPLDTCGSEFAFAVYRMATPFTWGRQVDGTIIDRDGQVDRPRYCANDGMVMKNEEAGYCCNGNHAPDGYELAAFVLRYPSWTPVLPFTKVCGRN